MCLPWQVPKQQLTMDSKVRLPALRAELENRAGHLERAGRDVFVLGLLTALWLYFAHPEMPRGLLLSLKLFAALGPVVYLVALYVALRLRLKALQLA